MNFGIEASVALIITQLAFTCSKLTKDTEQCVKYVKPNYLVLISILLTLNGFYTLFFFSPTVYFEQVNVDWRNSNEFNSIACQCSLLHCFPVGLIQKLLSGKLLNISIL